ncbi:Crp/Fnr family transcriptional regulator [Sphingomonas sp. A2-49]|uniref:Crp/Fnr family transcriptional regulator n=1 Tax=Sphingomonas sp. A2-49 TaxID=1391375 RepID=UPI0021D0F4FC|nr:Crp/Fnr family transcriptional regulator [Sphingomonas sp. A2-49]MCU6453255.1 Crp/Fnr family transcriptional regulator [Sphingomonas sp. A2-49]
MSQPDQPYTTNTLLNALSDDDLALLKPHLIRVDLARGQVLVTPNTPIEHVYFPEGGVVSIVSIMAQSGRIEAGIFGREGVSATCLLLGTDRSPHETFVQVNGSPALRIDADRYLAAVRQSESLRTMLLRYVQTVLVQTAQSMATNATQRVEARLARWLLMCHDRVDGDEIALTHEFMGMMISAERSGVTITLHILEGAGMIRSKRGLVMIRDRDKLEELAGDSYGLPEAEYRQLIGPLGPPSAVLPFDGRANPPL